MRALAVCPLVPAGLSVLAQPPSPLRPKHRRAAGAVSAECHGALPRKASPLFVRRCAGLTHSLNRRGVGWVSTKCQGLLALGPEASEIREDQMMDETETRVFEVAVWLERRRRFGPPL